MKLFNYRSLLAALIPAMVIFGCDDFLDEENRESLELSSATTDVEVFEQLVVRPYELARDYSVRYDHTGSLARLNYVLEDLGTDIVTRSEPISGSTTINDYVNLNATEGAVELYWRDQFYIIAAVNTVLDIVDEVLDLSEDRRLSAAAEVKFWRAWAYFNLVENFGGVPLKLHRTSTAEFSFTRDTEEDVYSQIIADLDDAIAHAADSPEQEGRVSKNVARFLKSKVLLTRGYKPFAEATDFAEAATLAEGIIASYPLLSSFSDLVSFDNQKNEEIVFSFLFGNAATSIGWGNTRHMMYKFRFYDYPGLERTVQGVGSAPTPYFFSLFEDGDERAAATFTRLIIATQDYKSVVMGDSVDVFAGDTAIYFPEIAWTQAEIDAVPYAVINPGTYFQSDGVTETHFPLFIKFDDPNAPFTQPDQSAQGTRDMVMMRSGEAYLIAAEAYLQNGNAPAAAAHLTTLRSRAGLTTPVAAGEVTVDYILDERAKELIGEVNRWMDLKRTSTLVSRAEANNPHVALNGALENYHMLRPIPQRERDLTGGALTQNPGYN